MIRNNKTWWIGLMLILSNCSDRINLHEFNLEAPDGSPFDYEQLNDRVIFLNYWASWCKPCLEEMPSINRLSMEISDKNVLFLLISDESPEKINAVLKKESYDLLFARKVLKKGEKQMRSFPQTYLIDKDGKVLFQKIGSSEWDHPEMIAVIRDKLKH